MRAVICRELTGVGGLEYVDNWPEPVAGPGEVLVDVKAAALNFPDLLMIQGLYQERPPLPFVVGTEMSGVVAAVGEGVTHVAPGDRVVAACGRTLAERVVAKAPLVIPAPSKLGFEAAAGICITYFTSMHALKQRAPLKAGETLLVLGAAGGVGTTAVELGKALGARVVAVARGADKAARCREDGADHVVDYTLAEPPLEQAVVLYFPDAGLAPGVTPPAVDNPLVGTVSAVELIAALQHENARARDPDELLALVRRCGELSGDPDSVVFAGSRATGDWSGWLRALWAVMKLPSTTTCSSEYSVPA